MAKFASSVLFILAAMMPSAHAADSPLFKISTKHKHNRVEVKVEKGNVVLAIHSPSGISSATIERLGQHWPDSVVLQLHLPGLESFKLTSGKVQLTASVSSQNGKVRLWQNDKEDTPLDAKNPYWLPIRMIASDGKPTATIPLKNGYFELPLPKRLFAENPKSFTVNWIDFYRN